MPPSLPDPQEPLILSPTVYYKPIIQNKAEDCAEDQRVSLLTVQDKVLTRLCPADFRRCLMQGACTVHELDGRVRLYNYHSRALDGAPRFLETDGRQCPYGFGVHSICLDPYFSVAADLSIYKLGGVIFVPIFVGVVMPDGETHDGFFVIRDVGAAIRGPGRFDFYTGFTKPFAAENPFHRLGFSDPKNRYEFRFATEEEARLAKVRTKYPGTRRSITISPQ